MLKWCFLNREKQSLWMFVSEMFHKMSKIFGRSDADGRLIKLSLKINLYPLKMKGSVLASNSLLSIGKICSLILVNWNVLGKFRWNSAFFLHKFFTTAVTMFSTVFRFARGVFFFLVIMKSENLIQLLLEFFYCKPSFQKVYPTSCISLIMYNSVLHLVLYAKQVFS